MFKSMRMAALTGMISLMMCGVSAALTMTGPTEIQAGDNPVSFGVESKAGQTCAWRMTPELGAFTTSTQKCVVAYEPPASIDGEQQVTIAVTVTDKNGQTDDAQVTLTIVRGDIPPTPTPTEQPDDCTAITVDGEVMEFGISGHKEASWRGWSHFVEAIKLLKKYNSSEGLVREYHEEREIFFRFQLERGHPLYELQLAEAEIQIGSCWKEVKQLPGYTYAFQGTEGRVRKVTVYVLDKK